MDISPSTTTRLSYLERKKQRQRATGSNESISVCFVIDFIELESNDFALD